MSSSGRGLEEAHCSQESLEPEGGGEWAPKASEDPGMGANWDTGGVLGSWALILSKYGA